MKNHSNILSKAVARLDMIHVGLVPVYKKNFLHKDTDSLRERAEKAEAQVVNLVDDRAGWEEECAELGENLEEAERVRDKALSRIECLKEGIREATTIFGRVCADRRYESYQRYAEAESWLAAYSPIPEEHS